MSQLTLEDAVKPPPAQAGRMYVWDRAGAIVGYVTTDGAYHARGADDPSHIDQVRQVYTPDAR